MPSEGFPYLCGDRGGCTGWPGPGPGDNEALLKAGEAVAQDWPKIEVLPRLRSYVNV